MVNREEQIGEQQRVVAVTLSECCRRTPSADILKELSDSQYTVYDVLPSFFNHNDPLVVLGKCSNSGHVFKPD